MSHSSWLIVHNAFRWSSSDFPRKYPALLPKIFTGYPPEFVQALLLGALPTVFPGFLQKFFFLGFWINSTKLVSGISFRGFLGIAPIIHREFPTGVFLQVVRDILCESSCGVLAGIFLKNSHWISLKCSAEISLEVSPGLLQADHFRCCSRDVFARFIGSFSRFIRGFFRSFFCDFCTIIADNSQIFQWLPSEMF